ncbi:hypothetical protein D3C80_1364290 [compost metagenome]
MLFPQGIQRLQHHAFLEVAHHLGANHFFFTLVLFLGFFQNTLTQRFFVQLRLFIQPFGDRHIQIEIVFQTFGQPLNIPLFFQRLRLNVAVDSGFEHVFTDAGNGFANVRHVQQFVTLAVDRAALIVGHVIVFQQLLTNVEVAAFYFTLGIGNCFGDPWVLNGLTFFHPQFTHHVGNAIGGENTHQGIFHRQVEAG